MLKGSGGDEQVGILLCPATCMGGRPEIGGAVENGIRKGKDLAVVLSTRWGARRGATVYDMKVGARNAVRGDADGQPTIVKKSGVSHFSFTLDPWRVATTWHVRAYRDGPL
jgi:hypothetical protein